MKTLILYASKHGAAREIAQRISSGMADAVIHDLKHKGIPPLAQFDCVITGSSLYAGSIRREAKAFLSKNTDGLQGKRIGLFLCGLDAKSEKNYFAKNFSPDIVQAAKAAVFLGGIFDPKKCGKMERFIMKIVAKQSGYVNTINNEKIKQFIEAMKT